MSSRSQSPINHSPINVTLTPGIVAENSPPGISAGSLTAGDPDADDTLRFAVVGGRTDLFKLEGTNIVTRAPVNFEQLPSVPLMIRVIDNYGLSITQKVSVLITDLNEPPKSIQLIADPIYEEVAPGTLVGLFEAQDSDVGDSVVLLLVDDAGGQFRLNENRLEVAKPLNVTESPTPTIRVQARDRLGLTLEQSFILKVIPLSRPNISFKVLEDGIARKFVVEVDQTPLSETVQLVVDASIDLIEWRPLLEPPVPINEGLKRYFLPAIYESKFLRVRILRR